MSSESHQREYKMLKHNSRMSFYNGDGEEIGAIDFTGAYMTFEGNADASAMIFMENISTVFQYRLAQEYNKGYRAGKDFTRNKT